MAESMTSDEQIKHTRHHSLEIQILSDDVRPLNYKPNSAKNI